MSPPLRLLTLALSLLVVAGGLASAQDLSWQLVGEPSTRHHVKRLRSFQRNAHGHVKGWEAESFARRLQPPRLGEPAIPMFIAPLIESELELVYTKPLPGHTTHVALDGRFHGEGSMHLELRRDGDLVAASEAIPLDSTGRPFSVVLALPEHEGNFDALALVCEGQLRRLGVASIHFELHPPGAEFPELAAPRGVTLGDVTLTGGRLEPGQSVVLDAAGGRVEGLLYSWARVGEGSAPGALKLEWEEAGEPRERLVSVGTSSVWRARRWQSAEIDGPLRMTSLCKDTLLLGPVRRLGPAREDAPLALLMTSGSHRGDHWSLAFRGVDAPTPNLAAFGRDAWVFAQAMAPTNHAVPAQAALHTGLSPRDTGVLRHGQRLTEPAATLAEAFASAQYTSLAVVGGSHLAPAHSGLGQGFVRVEAPPGPALWSAEEVVARGLALLEQHAAEPVFLWLAFTDGRWPHEATSPSMDLIVDPRDRLLVDRLPAPDRVEETMPRPFREAIDLDALRARYKASILDLDAALAPLLEHPRVRAAPRLFVGDHGLALGRHHTWFKPLGLYPTVLHVPLIVAAPRMKPRRVEQLVPTLDVGRTLLDLAGLKDVAFPGRTLIDWERPADPLFALESDGLSASVRRGDRQLILQLQRRSMKHVSERFDRFTVQLYDLSEDWYAEDVLDHEAEPDGLALRDELLAWLRAQPEWTLAQPVPIDPLLRDERFELGYLGNVPVIEPRLLIEELCSWCPPP